MKKAIGQIYILSLLIMTSVFITGMFIQGLALNQLKTILDMKRSMTAIFTADTGAEAMFDYLFNNGPYLNCFQAAANFDPTQVCQFQDPQGNLIGRYWVVQSCNLGADPGCGTTNPYYFFAYGEEAQNRVQRVIEVKPK